MSKVQISVFENPPTAQGRPRNTLPEDYAAALIDAISKLEGPALANATGDKPFDKREDARKRADIVKRDMSHRGHPIATRILEIDGKFHVGVKAKAVADDNNSADAGE